MFRDVVVITGPRSELGCLQCRQRFRNGGGRHRCSDIVGIMEKPAMQLLHVPCFSRVLALLAVTVVMSSAPSPARADFFDGARQTFQTDIPHFFQDDIPCAFGGQPTSHTKTACKEPKNPRVKTDPAAPVARPNELRDAPARSNR